MNDIFNKTFEALSSQKLRVIDKDIDRPWGGFFVIDEKDSQNFSGLYFSDLEIDKLKVSGMFSPKILIIAPNQRLSWQYHHRRSEIWKVTSGENLERNEKTFQEGDEIRINQGERHRIIGTNKYSIVAEIWIHTNKDNPSDEDDIVRIKDDYGR